MRGSNTSVATAVLLVATLSFFSAGKVAAGEAPGPAAPDGEENRAARERLADVENDDLPTIAPGPEMTLSKALELTEARNYSVEAARADIESARAAFEKSWAALLPSAQGTMTLTHNDHADTATVGGGIEVEIRPQDTLQGAIQASIPLVNPQVWAGMTASKLGVEVARLTLENVRQEMLLATARAFYQALTARALIDVQENLLSTSLRHLAVARTRHISGVGSRLDVIRARSEVVRIRQELTGAHTAFNNARDSLGVLTGSEGLPLPVEGPGLSVPAGEDDLVEKAMRLRPDIQLTRKRIDLSEKQLDVAWMQFVPTLNASWQLTHQFTSPSAFGSTDRSRWSAFLTLTVPLYNQTRYADLDEKRAALTKARIQADDSKRNVGLQVRTAWRDYRNAVEQLAAAEEQTKLSREALLLAQSAYESGTGSSLEVTDASRTSRQDEVNLAIKRFSVQAALLELMHATGEKLNEDGGGGSR